MTEGLFTGPDESSFKSRAQIFYEQQPVGQPIYSKDFTTFYRDFSYWQQEMERRQELDQELDPVQEYIEIDIPTDRPIAVGLLGDLHLGSPKVDFKKLGRDIQVIKEHPLCRVFTLGDLTDSFFWNPAQDEDNFNSAEQYSYMRSILEEIKGKMLGSWMGNHDFDWERRGGFTTKYHEFSERFGCPVFHGIGFIRLGLIAPDGSKVTYNLAGAHEAPGSSIYTNAHPGVRMHREYQNIDVAMVAHTHRKGMAEQPIKEFGGGARDGLAMVTGTYKKIDGYGRRKGYGAIPEEQRGMSWVILNHDRKMIRPMSDTDKMLETMAGYLKD